MRGKEIKLVVKNQMQNITKHTNKNRTKADQKLYQYIKSNSAISFKCPSVSPVNCLHAKRYAGVRLKFASVVFIL